MGIEVEVYPGSGSASSKEAAGSGMGEACKDAMHRLLVAIEKKDVEGMHEALKLHEAVCEDDAGAEEDEA